MLLEDAKKRYGYKEWPDQSSVQSNTAPLNSNMDAFPEYRLLNRYSLGIKEAYEDVYVSADDRDERISLRVINTDSFEQAKEHMITHLSSCANPEIPRLSGTDGQCDLAFGARNEDTGSISFLRGRCFVSISSIGHTPGNLDAFLEFFNLEGLL